MRSYVLGDTLDSVMNYPLRDALIAFLMAQKDAAAVAKELSSLAQNYPKPFLYALMNLMGSHDRPRILNVLAGNDGSDIPRSQRADHRLSQEERMIGALREQLMLRFMFSVPGMPCIYYGDEAGVEGCADPFCRRTYPWGREDKELINFHREIIRIHRQNKEFKTGSLKCLTLDYNFLAYGRFTKNNHSVVLINNNENEITKELSVWELGIPRDCTLQRLILTGERGYDINPMEIEVSAGRITVTMPKTSSMILQYRTEEEEKTVKPKTRQSFWTFG